MIKTLSANGEIAEQHEISLDMTLDLKYKAIGNEIYQTFDFNFVNVNVLWGDYINF